MAHVDLNPDLVGIISLFDKFPEAAGPLCELAQALLRQPSSLTEG